MSFLSYPARFVMAFLLVCFVLLTQSGCTTVPEEKIVYKTQLVYVAIPDSLTVVAPPKKLVSKETYLAMELPQEKEIYLSEALKDVYKELNVCHGNLKAIKKIQGATKEVTNESKSRN